MERKPQEKGRETSSLGGVRLSAVQRKEVATLRSSAKRRESGLFVAEGQRCLSEVLPHYRCRNLIATSAWVADHSELLAQWRKEAFEALPEPLVAKTEDMERMSSLQTPQGVMAVLEIPREERRLPGPAPVRPPVGGLMLALDRVQDPGNLGAIIRVADWFGVSLILASKDTVDLYNPKVVQSTMGAMARVKVHYCKLADTLRELREAGYPLMGTFLDGESLYDVPMEEKAVIVMGNEGNGITKEVAELVDNRMLIPSFPPDRPTVESLNVATATAVTLAEFRRKQMQRHG